MPVLQEQSMNLVLEVNSETGGMVVVKGRCHQFRATNIDVTLSRRITSGRPSRSPHLPVSRFSKRLYRSLKPYLAREMAVNRSQSATRKSQRVAPPPPRNATTPTDGGDERWMTETLSVLNKNTRIWIIEHGDVVIENGSLGSVVCLPLSLRCYTKSPDDTDSKVDIIDSHTRWLTPSLVNIHPYPLSPGVDGLSAHGDTYKLAILGGVTTAQALPGGANNIGGQAFVIKFRETRERSTTNRVLKPPETLGGGTGTEWVHWSIMKHACWNI
ncbi:hypothetical protein D9619_012917 [Psilocybe cf. subviscida]|uniref:Uncharacterized protein n=1 Tax=Psilocybe cf. subviscida TaxID=2480587 RepID=A0A8H5BI55_9AGAR|nr:hypothetical protein D9619_012917 [Psilocybe cf. subviscida]